MVDKQHLAEKLLSQTIKKKCLIGFDGFTDEILAVVKTRIDGDHFTPMDQMQDLATLIKRHAKKSCNIELIQKTTKIGGNAAILTNALLEGGHAITFIGTIGTKDKIEPLFLPMAKRCDSVIPLGPSAHSDALEFDDGKVILGKLNALKHLNYDTVIQIVGYENLKNLLDESVLLVTVNWTMLPWITTFWEKLKTDFKLASKKRSLFVDLADPAKRTKDSLKQALNALSALEGLYAVTLGLNESEALCLGHLFSIKASMRDLGHQLQKILNLKEIIIHEAKKAHGFTKEECVSIDTPFTKHPAIMTGAGDHFNAGFCNGKLFGFTLEECLCLGGTTSSYYVRFGKTPTRTEIADFLKHN